MRSKREIDCWSKIICEKIEIFFSSTIFQKIQLMYASKIIIDNRKWLKTDCILVFLLVISYGCKKGDVSDGKKGEDTPKREIIEIISNHMDFQMPDSISSG